MFGAKGVPGNADPSGGRWPLDDPLASQAAPMGSGRRPIGLMLLSAGAATYVAKAPYADARVKAVQESADASVKRAQEESMKLAQECLKAARRVRDKDQQRCYRAVNTHDRDLCDWQAAQATEPWERGEP